MVFHLIEFEKINNNRFVLQKELYTTLINRLFKLNKVCQYHKQTVYITISIINACVSKLALTEDQFRLGGIVSFYLASKFNEVRFFSLKAYIDVFEDHYDEQDIISLELKIIKALDYNLIIPTIRDYSAIFIGHVSKTNHTLLINSLTKISIFFVNKYLPTIISTSCNKIACLLLNLDKNFCETIEKCGLYNPYNVSDVISNKLCKKLCEVIVYYLSGEVNKKKYKIITKEINKIFNLFSVSLTKEAFLLKLGIAIKDNFSLGNKTTTGKNKLITNQESFFEDQYVYHNPTYLNRDINMLCFKGDGSSGVVHKVIYKDYVYARKTCKENLDGIPFCFLREVSFLKTIHHKNIISLCHIENNCQSFLMEYMDSNLKIYIKLHINDVRLFNFQNYIAKELLEGLAYMHSLGFVHRDIKPSNILTKGEYPNITIKYCDFGSQRRNGLPKIINDATTQQEKDKIDDCNYTKNICTLHYRPPEVLLANKYDYKIDIWSLGCTIYEVATADVLFQGNNDFSQLQQIFTIIGLPSDDDVELEGWRNMFSKENFENKLPNRSILSDSSKSPHIQAVLKRGLILNPSKRASSEELLDLMSR